MLVQSYHNIELFLFFFFQAEDGIRDYKVTGVQTCALSDLIMPPHTLVIFDDFMLEKDETLSSLILSQGRHKKEIGRASCRERV